MSFQPPTIPIPALPIFPVKRRGVYRIITVNLEPKREVSYAVEGTFITVIESTIPLDKLYISVNDCDYFPASLLLPLKIDLDKISLKSDMAGTVVLLVATGEVVKLPVNEVGIVYDRVGLAKDATFKVASVSVVRGRSISANEKVFPSDISVPLDVYYARIYCMFTASGKLRLYRKYGAYEALEALNSDDPLLANCAYIFDVACLSGESINLVYTSAASATVYLYTLMVV